jgi:hypothetical protein
MALNSFLGDTDHMSTQATATAPLGVIAMQQKNLSRTELQEIVRKIHALRRVTKMTGFYTARDIAKLLTGLSVDDLTTIGEELNLKPREMPDYKRQQPICNRAAVKM